MKHHSVAYINKYFKKSLMYWILLVFSVVIYEFIDIKTNLNGLIVYTMFLSPVFYVFYHRRLEWSDINLIVVFLLLLMSRIVYPEYFRMSTIMYSGMFFVTFLLYKSLCKANTITIQEYQKFITYIIYAYAIVLIIQQIQVTVGLSVFNKFPWAFTTDTKYKLNALSQEPSNTLLIMPLLMFSYIKISEILRNEKRYHFISGIKKDKYVWFAFLYVCLTCGSFTVFFSLPVFFCYFINRQNLKWLPFTLLLGVAAGLVAVYLIQLNNTFLLERFDNLLQNVNISSGGIAGDGSSSVRTLPYRTFFQSFNLFDISTWMGHGIDRFEIMNTMGLLGYERKIGAENILGLSYDYGLIAGLFFFYFLFKNTTLKLFSFQTLFYILLFSVVGLNHYVLWLYIMLIYTNLYFEKKHNHHKLNSLKDGR